MSCNRFQAGFDIFRGPIWLDFQTTCSETLNIDKPSGNYSDSTTFKKMSTGKHEMLGGRKLHTNLKSAQGPDNTKREHFY